MPESKFSAADSALGYVYQIRCALLHTILHARDGTIFLTGIETLDDVSFSTPDGDPFELLQTKHHIKQQASLSDASVDLWKTMRVWLETQHAFQSGVSTKLYLLTTSLIPDASAASCLRLENRNIENAVERLNAAAVSSTNQTNALAYEAYLGLTETQKKSFLSQVYIIDAAPNILDLDFKLKQQLKWLAPRDHEEAFIESLEGWWFRRVLKHLTSPDLLIESAELEYKLDDLREHFKREALPIDDDLLDIQISESFLKDFTEYVFVKQIELVTPSIKRIFAAIRDYYRAYEQRSRWIRNDVIHGLELNRYERRLIEEWELVYEGLCGKLGESETEEAIKNIGANILSWAERETIPIRSNVTEPFLSRGSMHMLADERKIGWHPQFKERLEAIFSTGGS